VAFLTSGYVVNQSVQHDSGWGFWGQQQQQEQREEREEQMGYWNQDQGQGQNWSQGLGWNQGQGQNWSQGEGGRRKTLKNRNYKKSNSYRKRK
jgi:hypothetical protein